MACGNNRISRSYLSSLPSAPAAASSRLFQRSSTMSQQQVLTRLAELSEDEKRGWASRNYTIDRATGKHDTSRPTIEVLLDQDGQPTKAYPHVHVIHDESKNEVRVHITEGSRAHSSHSHHQPLPGNPDGYTVNAAVATLTAILRARRK